VLRMALRIAYRDVIPAGRHPVAALYLDLPAEEVDVNVHPAKTELRFREPDAVRGLIIAALRAALAAPIGVAAPPPMRFAAPSGHAAAALPSTRHFAEARLPLAAPPAVRQIAPDPAQMPPTEGAAPSPEPHPLGAPLAQIWDTYILALAADGALVLVDQHAAHERLTEETLAAEWRAGGIRAQPLLLPAVIELPQADVARLASASAELARFGLEIEPFGREAVLVRALPAVLGTPDPGPLLRDLADELAESGEAQALALRLDAVIGRLACHGSIRAGRKLGGGEMAALLRQMEATPRAATCSHGRPTFLKLSRAEIERLFGRR